MILLKSPDVMLSYSIVNVKSLRELVHILRSLP